MSRPPTYHSASTTSKSSSVYQSLPTLPGGPHRSPNNGQAAPIDESKLPCRRKSKSLQVLGITLILLTSLLLPLATWCWYVFYQQRTVFDWKNQVVFTTTNATRFLLLSTISTTVTKAIVGPLMALHAYTASADWLRSSQRDQPRRLPTTTHYGSLLSLYQGTSVIGLLSTCRDGLRRGHLAWPPVLKRVIAVLGWLLFLAYSLTVVGLWLQIDAEPVRSVPSSTDYPSLGYTSQNALFGRTINQTLCVQENARQNRSLYKILNCGLYEASDYNTKAQYTSSRAFEVLTNYSDASQAAWLDDNTAILAPPTSPEVGYRAKALGVRVTCQSMTSLCARCNSTVENVPLLCEGPATSPTLNCTASAKVNISSYFGNIHPAGPISAVDGRALESEFKGNPFGYGNVVRSSGYQNATLFNNNTLYYAGDTGFLVYRSGALNVLYCNVSVFDTTYQFTPPDTYKLISSNLSDLPTAAYVASGLYAWNRHSESLAGRGFEFIDGAGQRGNATYSDVFARQLSKIAISSLTRIIPATASDMLLAGSGTRVNLIAMLLLFILNACIIITTVAIGTHAAIAILHSDSKFVSAARGRLISPYPLLGDSMGGLRYDFEHHKSAVSAAMHEGAFLKETEGDRLQLDQEVIDGDPMKGQTLRLRPRRLWQ